jgi:hypothetical protein
MSEMSVWGRARGLRDYMKFLEQELPTSKIFKRHPEQGVTCKGHDKVDQLEVI